MQVVTVIGIDAYTQIHAAGIDAQGRPRGELVVGADVSEIARLVAWIAHQPGPRLVAVEGAKGFGRALTLALLAAGETAVDVATHLTVEHRTRSRRRGKDDHGDAVAIARAALAEPGLPRMDQAHLDADLKLLVDARDQLVAEQGRVRNRLHALLLGCSPGHRAMTRALISKAALARARGLPRRARAAEPVRGQLALAAVRRITVMDTEMKAMEVSIAEVMGRHPHEHLPAIRGVAHWSPRRSSVRPMTSLTSVRGRLRRARRRCTGPGVQPEHQPPPPRPRGQPATQPGSVHRGHGPGPVAPRRPGTTSPASGPKGRPPPKHGAASHGTSPPSTTRRWSKTAPPGPSPPRPAEGPFHRHNPPRDDSDAPTTPA